MVVTFALLGHQTSHSQDTFFSLVAQCTIVGSRKHFIGPIKYESVKFQWLLRWKLTDSTVKNIFSLTNQWKLTDLTVKYIFFTGKSVKNQTTDSISENFTDLDLESMQLGR